MRSVLALLLTSLFVLQPAVRANACGTRSLLLGFLGRSCCCESVRAPACCSSRTDDSPLESKVKRGSCGCEVQAPAPEEALPRSPQASATGPESIAHWIAVGAAASAAIAWIPLDPPSRPPGDPPTERDRPAPDAVARACGRGVNGHLAVLGVARR